MTTKKKTQPSAARRPKRTLAVRKETLRDLAPAGDVRGGYSLIVHTRLSKVPNSVSLSSGG